MRKISLGILFMVLLVTVVTAAPAPPAISAIGSNNATFTSNGAGIVWFRWGKNPDIPEWKTPNQTAAGGFHTTVRGSPYLFSTKYYVKACDITGCSAAVSFVSAATTPIPQSTYGATFVNITETSFDIPTIITNLGKPMTWLLPHGALNGGISVVTSLIVGFYFFGLWIRTRNIRIPTILGIITATMFLSANTGFGWGMPDEFSAIAQGLLYASITGLIMSFIKKG